MLVRPADLPRVLSAERARAYGITRAQARTYVRRGQWRALCRDVLLTRPDPPTRADWTLAGLILAGNPAALSGWDAAHLFGLVRGRPPLPEVLILTRTGGSRTVGQAHIRRVGRPFRWRYTSAEDPTLPVIPIVTPARAVADTALAYSDRTTVRAVVARAVQQQACSVQDLLEQLSLVARRDSGLLRAALGEISDGARSVAEIEAIHALRATHLPAFEVNVPVVDECGAVIAVVDVLWRALRAALEIDGREYHFTPGDWAATLRRHNRLTRLGLAVMHLPPAEVRAGAAWLAEVGAWLRARAAELGVAYRPTARPHHNSRAPFVLAPSTRAVAP